MAVLLLFLVLLLPLPAGDDAQLVVRVRDERGEGVAGLLVTAHGFNDQVIMGQAYTNAAGQAVLEDITPSQVRIRLSGTTATGVPLRLQSHDAEGITLHLNGADTHLVLGVERDGVVIVDPTNWAQEPVTRATSAVAVKATPASIAPAPALAAEPLAVQSTPTQSTLLLVLMFALLGLVAILVMRARRTA